MENSNEKVHTFTDDMTDVLQENKAGLIKKIIHEEEEKEEKKEKFSAESPQNKRYLLFGFLLLVISVVAVFFALINRDAFVAEVEPRFYPIIFNDEYTFLDVEDLEAEDIAYNMYNIARQSEVKQGSIIGIYPVTNNRVLILTDFTQQIEAGFQPTRDNFVDESFMTGFYVREAKPPYNLDDSVPQAEVDFFFLIQARSFIDMFDDLRAWEEVMFSDLHDFFEVDISAKTAELLTKDFEDGVVNNRNSRVLSSSDGEQVMMYVYADDFSVVIASSEEAVREVILRLAGSRIKK